MTPHQHRLINTAGWFITFLMMLVIFAVQANTNTKTQNKIDNTLQECEVKLYEHLFQREYPFSKDSGTTRESK